MNFEWSKQLKSRPRVNVLYLRTWRSAAGFSPTVSHHNLRARCRCQLDSLFLFNTQDSVHLNACPSFLHSAFDIHLVPNFAFTSASGVHSWSFNEPCSADSGGVLCHRECVMLYFFKSLLLLFLFSFMMWWHIVGLFCKNMTKKKQTNNFYIMHGTGCHCGLKGSFV